MTKTKQLLNAKDNLRFQHEIVHTIYNNVPDFGDTDAIIADLDGISWLDGYNDVELTEWAENGDLEITDYDNFEANCHDIINKSKDPKMADYYQKALDYEEDNISGYFLKPSGHMDAKTVEPDSHDIAQMKKHLTHVVMNSHFTAEDVKRFKHDKNDLELLRG